MTNDLLPDDRLIQNMCIAFIDGRIWPQTTSNYGVDPGDIRGMQNVLALLVEKGLVSTPNKPAEGDLVAALEAIHDLTDKEIKARFKCSDRSESDCGRGSVIYSMLSVPRNIAAAALSGHLATGKGGDAPQSDMVAVPREVIEEAAESIRFALNMDDLSDAEFSKLDLSLAMLQPYTRGE